MSGEVELERLVVRLMGDNANYKAMLQDSKQQTQSLKDNLQATGLEMTALGAAITGSIVMTGRHALGAWEQQELANLKMQAALEANGREVDLMFQRYDTFSSKMQELTVTADEVTLGMLQQAESFGITGAAAERAVKNAMALGAQKGMNPAGLMRMMVMLEQGETQMLGRLLPGLRSIEDSTERAAKAQEMLGKMFSLTRAEASSISGQFKQLANATDDMYEDFGKVIADGLKPMIELMRDVVKWVKDLSPSTKELVVELLSWVAVLGTIIGSTGAFLLSLHAITAAVNFFTASLAANPIVLFVAALALLGYGAYKLYGYLSQPAFAMDELKKKTESTRGTLAGFFKDVQTNAKAMPGGGERSGYLADKGNALTKDLENTLRKREELQKEYNRIAGPGATLGNIGTGNESAIQTKIDAATKFINEARKGLEELHKLNDEIAKNKDKTGMAVTDDTLQAWKKYNEELKLSAETMGMSAEEAELYKYKLLGITDEQLNATRAQQGKREAMKREQQAYQEVRGITESLEDEILALKLEADGLDNSTEAIKLNRLAREGGNKDMVGRAQDLLKQKEMLEVTRKNKEEGKRLIEQYATPQEKFTKTIEDLVRLQSAGALGPGTGIFDNAIKAAQKELDQAELQATVQFRFEGVEAVRAGTQEYQKLIGGTMAWQEGEMRRASIAKRLAGLLPGPEPRNLFPHMSMNQAQGPDPYGKPIKVENSDKDSGRLQAIVDNTKKTADKLNEEGVPAGL